MRSAGVMMNLAEAIATTLARRKKPIRTRARERRLGVLLSVCIVKNTTTAAAVSSATRSQGLSKR
jgi:hypothetical protein